MAERPYQGSHISFSVPRRSVPAVSHSASSSTSSASLSPSNSASQKGLRGSSAGERGAAAASTAATTAAAAAAASAAAPKQLKPPEASPERKADLVDVRLPWRPFYLQRKILVAYFAIFAGAVVGLEALLDYSGRHAGLGAQTPALRYLLRLAPTAILTLVAVLWARVEFQAKSAAPWLRLAMGPARVDQTLLLDYVSVSQPGAIWRALRNGDYGVACATAISLLLRLSVVISTGLLSVDYFSGMDQNMPITMQSEFANSAAGLAQAGSLSLFTMLGLQQDRLAYPDGLSKQFAFQQFASDSPRTTEFHATVDGFSAALECQAATLTIQNVENTAGGVQFNTSFNTQDCSIIMPMLSSSFLGSGTQDRSHFFARLGQGACGNSDDDSARRIVVFFGTGTIGAQEGALNATTTTLPVNATIPQSQQLICQPTYAINKVDVVKNGTSLNSIAMSVSPQTRQLDGVQPWDLAQAMFASYNNELAIQITDTAVPAFLPQIVNTDASMYLAFAMSGAQADGLTSPDTLLDETALEDFANSYFQQYAAILAHESLLQPASVPASSVAVLSSDRLIVRRVAAQTLAAIISLMVLLDGVIICFAPSKGFLPRDPNTIIDTATLLAHSRPLLQALRGAGGADLATVRSRLEASLFYTGVEAYDRDSSATGQGYFKILGGESSLETSSEVAEPAGRWAYPLGLHPALKTLVFVGMAGLIAALEVSLRVSDHNKGVGNVGDDTFLYLLWTVVPALVVALPVLYLVASDLSVRAVAPYAELIRGGSFMSMSMNLVDKLTPVAFVNALISGNWAVLGSTSAAILGALLPIFVASLFSTMSVPASTPVSLQSLDFFSNTTAPPSRDFCTSCTNGTLISSLLLDANVSYPDFTFGDLVFPALSMPSAPASMDTTAANGMTVTATIPAARPFMTCLFFTQKEITVNLTTDYKTGGIVNPLRIEIPGEQNRGTSELLASTFILGTADGSSDVSATTIDSNAFFGKADYRPIEADDGSNISHWVYAWGQLSNANTNQAAVEAISALSCNESMQQLNVDAAFDGLSLQIDTENPPRPIEPTAVASGVGLADVLQYTDLVNVSTPYLLDGFFSSLVTSRFAIPVADLGIEDNSIAQGTVSQAIIKQHGIIRAQVVSTWNRRPTIASDSQGQAFPTDIDGGTMGDARAVSFPATMLNTPSGGKRRVVQDAISTRILQALLGAVLIASLVSWLSLRRTNVLPRSPTSIASVAALLADGNVFGFLGRGAEWEPTNEVRTLFRDGLYVTARFSLDWGPARRRRREEALSSNGFNSLEQQEEEGEVFGINAVRTGGWGGGENVGLGMQARVGYTQRAYVRDLGWQT